MSNAKRRHRRRRRRERGPQFFADLENWYGCELVCVRDRDGRPRAFMNEEDYWALRNHAP